MNLQTKAELDRIAMLKGSQASVDAAVDLMRGRSQDVKNVIEDMRRKVGNGKPITYEDLERLDNANESVRELYAGLGPAIVAKDGKAIYGESTVGTQTSQERDVQRRVTVQTYQGQTVEVLRPAVDGDVGYDLAQAPQGIIRLADGTEKLVAMSEIVPVTQ